MFNRKARINKYGIAILVIAMFVSVMGTLTYAQQILPEGLKQQQGTPQTLQGEVLKIEGEFFVVKDRSGKEVRLRVDKSTQMPASLKPGAKVEAQVWEDGYAASIKEIQANK